MKITFTTPLVINTGAGQTITVPSMDVITFSFNLAPMSGGGNVVVSVTLRDSVSGYQQHFAYEDAALSKTFFQQLDAFQVAGKHWLAPLLNRLITDGKLPAGTLA